MASHVQLGLVQDRSRDMAKICRYHMSLRPTSSPPLTRRLVARGRIIRVAGELAGAYSLRTYPASGDLRCG